MENIRQPAVAGQFYPGMDDILEKQVSSFLTDGVAETGVLGAVMPHAGYIYSGSVAGETVSHLDVPGKVILLGPNHTGAGARISVFPSGSWSMPFGRLPVDEKLAGLIIDGITGAGPDRMAHVREHSIEVQLPFLYYRKKGPFTFVPITLSMLPEDECRDVGLALARIIQSSDDDILIVASSDMTHYESDESARKKDSLAIERMLQLDPAGLLEVVHTRRISMCGIIPVAVMLYALTALGAVSTKLVRYTTSAEASGDYSHVVGYAGIIIKSGSSG
ncbi:MAG: AmmeMemoRadiSam system protein B [Deltaproteobacteria bacterium]|nr:AmmeMemoRadiSam system protein B [Deltaproteobacteria bacterium]